ncbi:MAG TPA: response regulator [Blastocatellia bacterium]|nr:response regulator [Blastocatellia bacterium]
MEEALLSLAPTKRSGFRGTYRPEMRGGLVGIKTSSILIVDRKDAAHTFLASCLPDYYECVPARSAEQAIEKLRERPFDLVITDITMFNPSGMALCVFIHRTYPESILVAMSGLGGVQYEIEAMRQGAFEYIEEPFDSAEVCASVEHALRHKALFNRLSSPAEPPREANPLLEGAYEADGIESAHSFLRM